MKEDRFLRVHSHCEALYAGLYPGHWTDDEEVLLQLSAFSATLSPLSKADSAS
ncbi:MAG: hypothetical protein K0B87_08495 [Candidatus Syntrophosphaera sp.]|nr:hypothetical protein [Candidatus Syntrophosphaera sp.]